MAVKKKAKSSVKKPAAKKPAVKKAAKKPAPAKKKAPPKAAKPKSTGAKKQAGKATGSPLVKELTSLAGQLAQEEVAFLIKQAQVFIKNQKIRDRLKETTDSVTYEHRTVTAEEFQLPPLDKEKIEFVEGKDGGHFIIVVGTARNFFSRDEFKKIVALCHAAENEKDGMLRLHTWFTRNRSDVLRNTEISGAGDVALSTMYNAVINTYAVKA